MLLIMLGYYDINVMLLMLVFEISHISNPNKKCKKIYEKIYVNYVL